MKTETAKEYWKGVGEYPFGFTRGRRIHELNYLVPKLKGKTLLDLGCGDGSLLNCLVHLTEFETYYGFDLSEELLKGVNPKVKTAVYDLTNPTSLPEVDVTIIAGVIQYVFQDEAVERVLAEVNSPVVFIRSTCTLKEEDEAVEKDGYASLYRTLGHTLALLSKHFEIRAVDRVYPDNIESPFGTKQFYFEAHKRR